MPPLKASLRGVVDRFAQHYFDHQADELRAAQAEQTARLLAELRAQRSELQAELEAKLHTELHTELRTELRTELVTALEAAVPVRARVELLPRLEGIEALERLLEEHVDNFEQHVLSQFEGQAQRQAELRWAIDEQVRALYGLEATEARLEARVGDLTKAMGDEVATLRADLVEITRMLRMQGDAADQVAEVLGRTIARLSAEVDQLSEALHSLAPEPVQPE